MAFGISMSAAGVGNMCFPWISSSLTNYYGWRGALMISSGFMLQMCVSGMLIFPVRKTQTNTRTATHDASQKPPNSWLQETRILFQNGSFLLHSLNSFFIMFSASVVFTHVAAFAKSEGFSSEWESLLISVVGGAALGKFPWKASVPSQIIQERSQKDFSKPFSPVNGLVDHD